MLAGDWTHNVIDAGCVEAAVISGVSAGRSLRPLPSYVEYGPLATAPGPIVCDSACLYGFWLKASTDSLTTLLDRVFKQPTGALWRYRPLMSLALLTFGVLEDQRSEYPGFAGRVLAREGEVAIWITTVAERYHDGAYAPDHLALFTPYICVDDPIALTSGREVYGFPKAWGWMSSIGAGWSARGRLPDPPGPLTLDVLGGPANGSGPASRKRLLTIEPREGVGQGRAGEGLDEMIAHFRKVPEIGREIIAAGAELGSPGVGRSFAEFLGFGRVRLVFLKQIRHAARGDLAALSQIVEARAVVPRPFRWRALEREYRVSIEPVDGHPLIAELGFAHSQSTHWAFATQFRFSIEAGTVVWPT